MNQGVEDGPGIGHRHSKLFEFSFGKQALGGIFGP